MATVCHLMLLLLLSHSTNSDNADNDDDDVDNENSDDNPVNFDFDFDVSDVCVSEFHIEKYTMATTDSYRDTEMLQLIFPEATPEYAPHFIQDHCARQSKLSLPYTCFKIHGPQTWNHAEGYLSIKTLENEFTKKFYSVIHKYSDYKYDAFFDYNLGLWVKDLDKYLYQINLNYYIIKEYIGLKWYSPQIDKIFYSLIIHSPNSQRVFELMSFNKPDADKYTNLRDNFEFTEINEIRASFIIYTDNEDEYEYPWNRQDNADIVPIKISYACVDIDKQIEFYVNVLEAKLLYKNSNITSIIDGVIVHNAFLQPVNSKLEIEYVERPVDYTYGEFSTKLYQELLTKTHNDRITSPICGLDRWFDNHYGYNTLKFVDDNPDDNNYMDRVLSEIINRKLKYRLYYTPYSDESPEGKYWMKQYGYSALNTLYIFDMNGQTVQMIGSFLNINIDINVPIYNKQWCYVPCPFKQAMGVFDDTLIYVENTDDIISQIVVGDIPDPNDINQIINNGNKNNNNIYIITIAVITISIVICIMLLFCLYRCIMRKDNDDDLDQYDNEIQSLLQGRH